MPSLNQIDCRKFSDAGSKTAVIPPVLLKLSQKKSQDAQLELLYPTLNFILITISVGESEAEFASR